ncbi:MAG: tetratricopeptide repeat protein, partial [Acidobacteriota bacterium]
MRLSKAGALMSLAAFLMWAGINGTAWGQQGAEQHLRRGLQLLQSGATAAAIAELQTAVQLRPESPEARYHLGRALFAAGRAEESVTHLQAALERVQDAGPVQFLLGQVWLQLGDFAAARDALEAAERSRPGYPPIHFYRAELCYRMGDVQAALERLASLSNEALRWSVPRARAGVIALEAGQAAEAVNWFREALKLAPDDATLWTRLGSALVAAQQAREAVDAYRRAVELAPERQVSRMALAMQLLSLQENEAALAALDGVLATSPKHGVAHYQRAKLLSQQGKKTAALEELQVAFPDLEERAASGQAQRQAGGRHPNLAEARGLQVELLGELGRAAEAEEVARALVASEPWYPEGHFLFGNLLLRRGESSGEEQLRRFKALSDAREHRQLGDYYRQQVDAPQLARREYEAALVADPQDRDSLLWLAALHRATGEVKEPG